MFNNLFKKKNVKPLLTDEDNKQLKELERIAYMETAKELIQKRGQFKAEKDLNFGGSD